MVQAHRVISRWHLAAENLFLALNEERRVQSRRADDATRITLVVLSQLIDWRAVLTIVKSDTLIGWHRKGFRLFWRWKSGRPVDHEYRRLSSGNDSSGPSSSGA